MRTTSKPKAVLKLAAPRDPLVPAAPSTDEIAAVQAIDRGDPSKEQCRVFMNLLLIKICGVTSRTHQPGRPDVSAFAEGQRDVGLQINGLRSIDLRAIEIAMKEKQNG